MRASKLKGAREPALKRYDAILIDCPPNLGLLTVDALMAATLALIPMATESFAMLGVSLLGKTVNAIRGEAH